jgi:hypothetical protein
MVSTEHYTNKGFNTYSQIRSYWDTSQWMHVVVTSDAGGQRKIFINGSLDGSASGQEFGEQNASFIMGCDIRSGAYTGAFSGLIDDVRVYSRALADAEVTSLYYQERTKLLQKINFAPILDQLTTDSVTLSAEGGESGNPVTFAVTSGPGVISNGNTLTFTDSGLVTITASQLGNAEYLPAQDVSRTFNVKLIPEPDIVVSQAGTILEDGISVVPFSSKLVGQQGQSLNFTITNPGTGELNSLSISKNGANADDFSVSMLNSTSIPRGTSEVTFNVTFSPTGLGTRQAEIHIGSNVIGIKNRVFGKRRGFELKG